MASHTHVSQPEVRLQVLVGSLLQSTAWATLTMAIRTISSMKMKSWDCILESGDWAMSWMIENVQKYKETGQVAS